MSSRRKRQREAFEKLRILKICQDSMLADMIVIGDDKHPYEPNPISAAEYMKLVYDKLTQIWDGSVQMCSQIEILLPMNGTVNRRYMEELQNRFVAKFIGKTLLKNVVTGQYTYLDFDEQDNVRYNPERVVPSFVVVPEGVKEYVDYKGDCKVVDVPLSKTLIQDFRLHSVSEEEFNKNKEEMLSFFGKSVMYENGPFISLTGPSKPICHESFLEIIKLIRIVMSSEW